MLLKQWVIRQRADPLHFADILMKYCEAKFSLNTAGHVTILQIVERSVGLSDVSMSKSEARKVMLDQADRLFHSGSL